MTAPTFTLASGELSAYALACGYLQRSPEHHNGDHVELSHDGCYHVHVRESGVTMDAETGAPLWVTDPDHTPAPGYGAPKVRADWHTFDTLTDARRFYRAEVRRLARKHAEVTIGSRSRNGLYEVTDTAWDHNGTLRVTVRELIGERELPATRLRAMRDLARRALPHPERTRSARAVRTWYAEGCTHVTFHVSRNG